MADRVGRKAALQVGAVPGLIGWVLIFVAQYTTNTSTFKSFLLLGRVLAGVGTGMQSTVIPVCTMSCRYSVKLHCMGVWIIISTQVNLLIKFSNACMLYTHNVFYYYPSCSFSDVHS